MDLKIVTNLDEIGKTWRAFEQHADCTVFQLFDWLWEWYRHIGINKNITPIIVQGFYNNELIFLIPLAIERRRLIWLGGELCDYNAPLLSTTFPTHVKPGQFEDLWGKIVRKISDAFFFDVIELDKIPELVGSQINPFIELPVLMANFSSHAATLSNDWEQFSASKISGRHDRRNLKILTEKYGEVRFVNAKDDDINRTLEVLIQQKRRNSTRMGIEDVFARNGYLEFFQAVVSNPQLHDVIHVSHLDSGDTPLATALGLQFNSRYLLIMNSYDHDFSKYSPGRIHIQKMLQYAISQKMLTYDFTIGDEPYKLVWSDIHPHLYYYFKSNTMRGRLVTSLHILAHKLHTWYHQTRLLTPEFKQTLRKIRRLLHRSVH